VSARYALSWRKSLVNFTLDCMRHSAHLLVARSVLIVALFFPTGSWAVDVLLSPVGETSITIVIPQGFVDAAKVSPELHQAAQRMTVRGNRTLAYLVREEDARAFSEGKLKEFEEFLSVQIPLHRENQLIPLPYFGRLKTFMKNQASEVFAAIRPSLQKHFDRATAEIGASIGDASLDIQQGEMVPLGAFDEGPDSISMAVLSTIDFTSMGHSEKTTVAMSMSVVIAKGKMLYLYAYSPYQSGYGLQKVRGLTRPWVYEFLRANPAQ
jgi:hypothetical protein